MKIRGYALVGAGLAVGFVLGTRAGRERYEQLAVWARKTSDDLGVPAAVDRVVETTRDTAGDLRDTATEQARDLVETGSRAVSDTIHSAGDSVRTEA